MSKPKYNLDWTYNMLCFGQVIRCTKVIAVSIMLSNRTIWFLFYLQCRIICNHL